MARKEKLSSWRKALANKKKTKRKQIWLFGLSLGLLLGVSFLLFRFYQTWEQRLWTKQTSFLVAFNLSGENQEDQLLLVSFQSKERSAAAFLLPENLFLRASRDQGDYRASSLYQLDKLEQAEGRLFKKALAENLGLIVDARASLSLVDDFNLRQLNETNFKGEMGSLLFRLLRRKGEMDLNTWDLFRLYLANLMVKEGRIKLVNLAQSQAIITDSLPDGSKVLRLDIPRIDRLVEEYFSDDALREENLDMAVLNATQLSGLAQEKARILGNLGARVVKIDQYEGELEVKNDCLLVGSEAAIKSYTFFRFKTAFTCDELVQDVAWARSNLVLIFAR